MRALAARRSPTRSCASCAATARCCGSRCTPTRCTTTTACSTARSAGYDDVTARVEQDRRTRYEADTDALTGLANRRALERTLDGRADARRRTRSRSVALLMLDLDGFKAINDTHGHAAGDEALREVARRLRRCVRERDLVARLGGDEFVVVLTDLGGRSRAVQDSIDRIQRGAGGADLLRRHEARPGRGDRRRDLPRRRRRRDRPARARRPRDVRRQGRAQRHASIASRRSTPSS